MSGLGCGHEIAPVLERLDKIKGVEASSANHTGTLIRIAVVAAADRERVAQAVQKDLAAEDRKPVRLKDGELKKALDKETWRTKERIGELSAIEFRKLALDRVRAFALEEKLAEDVADKLYKLAEREWDRLAEAADRKEGKKPPHQTDWLGRCSQFATMFSEQAKELLTAAQHERLREMLAACIERLRSLKE